VAETKTREGWYDVSTLNRAVSRRGKKTMGYELWEQFGGGKTAGRDFLSHGGGVGLIGMCKAFDEMQEMGWIGAERRAWWRCSGRFARRLYEPGKRIKLRRSFFPKAATVASGLRVPRLQRPLPASAYL